MKSDAVFAVEHAGWPALLVDSAAKVCRANQAAVRHFGPALEGSSVMLASVWADEKHSTPEQFLARWERAPSPTVSLTFRLKGGVAGTSQVAICAFSAAEQKYFLLQLLPHPSAPIEAKTPHVEAGLAQKQKLDCALQLARTVALDFNNALTSVLGHSSLLLSQAGPDHPWRPALLEVEKSAARAAEVASDLASFSRQERDTRSQPAGNLNLILQRAVESVQQAASKPEVSWAVQLERRLFVVKFDEGKLQQAFAKVIENALEALSGAGRISVQSRNLELAEPAQDREARLAAGAYVCVEVADTGSGIGAEVLPRIFEPFFTTKRGHRGLGLAWVYGIISNHGGGVAVSSQPAAGTSVRVYLPAERRLVQEDAVVTSDVKGTETVLIVDDEEMLLTLGQHILSPQGYKVLTSTSGQKALEILERAEPPVDLVITDLVMPRMSGRELVEAIERTAPATRILCTSGYALPASQPTDHPFLQKPFTAQELLAKVRRTLALESS